MAVRILGPLHQTRHDAFRKRLSREARASLALLLGLVGLFPGIPGFHLRQESAAAQDTGFSAGESLKALSASICQSLHPSHRRYVTYQNCTAADQPAARQLERRKVQ